MAKVIKMADILARSERHSVLYISYDNEAFMNTGIQVDPPGHVIEHIQDRVPEIPFVWLGHDQAGMRFNKCTVDDA